jgi:hypothetical protein
METTTTKPVTDEKKETSAFENSLKSNDTEEKIDIWFYRPIGYQIALFCAKVGIRPNPVTIISIFFGVAAGILFYPQQLWINVIGMLSLMFANSLDSADGQLARMTNDKSRFGRILDGVAGDFWFIAIHIALCLPEHGRRVECMDMVAGCGCRYFTHNPVGDGGLLPQCAFVLYQRHQRQRAR